MKREKKAVQRFPLGTVKKALRCCAGNECSPSCPFYKYGGLVCDDVAPVMESALAIIEGEQERKEKALTEYAQAIKAHYPHSPSIQKTIDVELDIARGLV